MADNLTDLAENALLDHINGVATLTVTAPLKVALVTVIGTDAAAGTEVVGGSYARQTITFGSASGGSASNTNTITFTNMPTCTVVGVDIYDSNGTPKRLWWGQFGASKAFNSGDTAQFAIGAITLSLA